MDAGQMKSVISNLVINSLDAMPDGGLLRISTRRASGPERVIIEVRDNGSGIKKEHLPLIFDPFFTTKETGKGTGLGLSITLSIVERHGGTIRVSSEEGAGTSFVIELPAV
jgi:signal transduction histidine kinase